MADPIDGQMHALDKAQRRCWTACAEFILPGMAGSGLASKMIILILRYVRIKHVCC